MHQILSANFRPKSLKYDKTLPIHIVSKQKNYTPSPFLSARADISNSISTGEVR